jgi:hypothetical protein
MVGVYTGAILAKMVKAHVPWNFTFGEFVSYTVNHIPSSPNLSIAVLIHTAHPCPATL